MTPRVALTIAGSDSSAGEGVQADLKTFAALGAYGTSAITALTAQNTTGVRAVHVPPAEFVVAQVDAVLADFPVAAVKTGMLATAAIIEAVAELAAAGRLPHLVVDPVMVASSGDRLLEPAAERSYVDALLPHAMLITPNLAEAQVLLGGTIRSLADQHDAARELGNSAAVPSWSRAVTRWRTPVAMRSTSYGTAPTSTNCGTGGSTPLTITAPVALSRPLPPRRSPAAQVYTTLSKQRRSTSP